MKRNLFMPGLLFFCAALTVLCSLPGYCGEMAVSASAKKKMPVLKHVPASVERAEPKALPNVTVYYFHGYARCSSCHKIEEYTKAAADSFASGTYAGRVSFFPVNVEKPVESHFVKDYQLVAKAVVLQSVKEGKPGSWENLNRIWLELGDRDRFISYVKEHIVKRLEAE